jgi:hypothetical protein
MPLVSIQSYPQAMQRDSTCQTRSAVDDTPKTDQSVRQTDDIEVRTYSPIPRTQYPSAAKEDTL